MKFVIRAHYYYLVLGRIRVPAGRSVGQQDDVLGGGRSAAAADDEHVVMETPEPGRHVGSGRVALAQSSHRRQQVTSRREPQHITPP